MTYIIPSDTATPASEPTPGAAPAAAATTPAADEKKKKKIAEHDWIDAKGDVVEDMESATGIKYRSLASDEVFTYQIPGAEPGKVLTMFAVFGARTKATNSALAANEKRKRDNTFESTNVEHIAKLFGEITDGQWGEPGEAGPKGPKYDLDVLAQVIYDQLVKDNVPNPDLARIRAKCGDSPAYVRGAMQHPVFANEYNQRKGTAPKAVSTFNV